MIAVLAGGAAASAAILSMRNALAARNVGTRTRPYRSRLNAWSLQIPAAPLLAILLAHQISPFRHYSL
jgi:hypothetical protein